MKCNLCEKEYKDEANFCPYCGNRMEKENENPITIIGKISLIISLILAVFLFVPIGMSVVVVGFCLSFVGLFGVVCLKIYKVKDRLLNLSLIILSVELFYLLWYLIIYLTM